LQIFFTPFNQTLLNERDLDLGSGGTLLMKNPEGKMQIIGGGKEGTLYLLDSSHMGSFHPHQDEVLQKISYQVGALYSTPAIWKNRIYVVGVNDALKVFSYANGKISTNAIDTASETMDIRELVLQFQAGETRVESCG